MWDRALSDTELRSISENPYQILRPANDRLWLDVVAGGGGVSGSLSAIDAPDTASFSGSASAPSVTGTLSATDAQDAASFAGSLIFSGSLAATEPPDVATFTGTAYAPAPGVSGTLAATDIADTAVSPGRCHSSGRWPRLRLRIPRQPLAHSGRPGRSSQRISQTRPRFLAVTPAALLGILRRRIRLTSPHSLARSITAGWQSSFRISVC